MIVVQPNRGQSWRGLAELQLTFALLMLGFLPVGGLIVNAYGSASLLPFAAIYGGSVLFVQRRMVDWKCPGCHKAFLRRKGSGFALLHRSHCGNCGLRRGL